MLANTSEVSDEAVISKQVQLVHSGFVVLYPNLDFFLHLILFS